MNSAREIADGIVQLLEKRNQLDMLPSIITMLSEHNAAHQKYNIAVVRTSVGLNDGERDMLRTRLSELFGRNLNLEEHIDEQIIGGMYIQVGDTVLDYTLSGDLGHIAERIEK